jgi:SMP-30/Gluconolactonase/LRE-like region
MAVDTQGRAYVGNFGFDLMGGAPLEPAALHRVDPDGAVTEVAADLWFPNGSVITPDGVLIVNETFGNRVTAFDLTGDGRLVNRRTWAELGRLPTQRDIGKVLPQLSVAPEARVSMRKARCGSPTPPGDGCSGSPKAATSWTKLVREPPSSRAPSAGQTGRPSSPAPRPTSTRLRGLPPARPA